MKTKIPSGELKIGMFVSDLDRPWLGTPFLLQGFLIENHEEIKKLQEYCTFVLIEWGRSSHALQAANPAPKKTEPERRNFITSQSTSLNHASVSISQKSVANHSATESDMEKSVGVQVPVANLEATMFKPKEFGHSANTDATPQYVNKDQAVSQDSPIKTGLLAYFSDKLKNLFNFKGEPDARKHTTDFDQQPATPEVQIMNEKRPSFIPANVELTIYNEVRPVEDELAPASKAYKHIEEVLHGLAQDLHSDKNFDIEEVEVVIQEVVDSMVRNPNALMLIMRLRQQDNVGYGHGLQTAIYMIALGRQLGLPKDFLERLGITGLLLDIGNIKLPSELLQKHDQLTPEEFEIIKSHIPLGLAILKEAPNLHTDILDGIAQHHERENGTGYPAGLIKGNISLFGRMAAIVNSFTALTNARIYNKTVSAHEALKSISTMSGEYYLASMVEQFIQTIGIFPAGSLVELSTGEVAVVVSQSKVRRLKPRVLIISNPNKSPASHPVTIDLLSQPETKSAIHILRGLPTGAFDLDVREYYLA